MNTTPMKAGCRQIVVLMFLTSLIFAALPPSSAQNAPSAIKSPEHYFGTAEDAVVGVTAVWRGGDGANRTQTGNGLLLKADGFILVPASLFPQSAFGLPPKVRARCQIVLYPGTALEKRVVCTLPDQKPPVTPYVVLYAPKAAAPALLTLTPKAWKEGQPAEIAWRAAGPGTGAFGALSRVKAAVVRPSDGKKPVADVLWLDPVPEQLPAGAVVLGPEGKVVGMYCPTPEGGAFRSLHRLHLATNCVTPLPSTDAEFEKQAGQASGAPEAGKQEEAMAGEGPAGEAREENAGKPAQSMVRVAGGTLRLPPALRLYQTDIQGAEQTIVPPFLIDEYEVSNRQYFAFWKALEKDTGVDTKTRQRFYPLSWAGGQTPFPKEIEQMPVIGVPVEGARAYARWVGKRLPTPYEWVMAALGSEGADGLPAWVAEYMAQRRQTWETLRASHLAYAGQALPRLIVEMRPEMERLVGARGLYNGEKGLECLPWFFHHPRLLPAAQWSKEQALAAAATLNRQWESPLQLLPVGTRKFDKGACGAKDMLLNAWELVAPHPGNLKADADTPYFLNFLWSAPSRREHAMIVPGNCAVVQDEWSIHLGEVLPGVVGAPGLGELPLLSRRVRSSTTNWSLYRNQDATRTYVVQPGYAQEALAFSWMYETAAMLYPVEACSLRLMPGLTVDYGPVQENVGCTFNDMNSPFIDQRQERHAISAASFGLWYPRPNPRREMGRTIDVDAPEGRGRKPEQVPGKITSFAFVPETYLLPGGFRCVR